MYVHVLPFQNICSLTYFQIKIFVRVLEVENILPAFFKDIVFLGEPQYARGFSNFSLILCLQLEST